MCKYVSMLLAVLSSARMKWHLKLKALVLCFAGLKVCNTELVNQY